jgi:hypothetical protein
LLTCLSQLHKVLQHGSCGDLQDNVWHHRNQLWWKW